METEVVCIDMYGVLTAVFLNATIHDIYTTWRMKNGRSVIQFSAVQSRIRELCVSRVAWRIAP